MFYPHCPTQTVIDPPIPVYQDYYHPQIVQVIHPIEIIRRHHCIPVPHHIATLTTKDELCTVSGHKKRSVIKMKKP